ncbi:MAG: hypothetical protein A4E58_00029 [Syntrophorhabdus sp. PtaB.Bin006]|nr:MAG: hypothetical protein A4E58_00029 [Syntrophorhabdus sp. PtaB.Bin006]
MFAVCYIDVDTFSIEEFAFRTPYGTGYSLDPERGAIPTFEVELRRSEYSLFT